MNAIHTVIRSAFLVAGLFGMTLGVGASSALAAPAVPAAHTSAFEINKVTLGETSIDGPGFVSDAFTFEGQTTEQAVLAWTGTDQLHSLNILTSKDGLHYGHKITLAEQSMHRPAVAQMSPAAGGAVLLAWTGTDANHSLNVLFDAYGAHKKIILRNDNSDFAPGLAIFNGNAYLAWTGTDSLHRLNIQQINLASFTLGGKTILSNLTSSSGPTLTHDDTSLILGWATSAQHVNLASSTDSVHFTNTIGSGGLAQATSSAPSFTHHEREGGPSFWIAWTGTDPAHTVSLQWTTQYPSWPDLAHTRTFTPEQAFGAPVLVFNQGVVVAWTGTDSAHHLNVARFDGQ